MTEAMMLTVFFTVSGVCFLGTVFSSVWLVQRLFAGWLGLKDRELEFRRQEAHGRLEQARLQGTIPVWVDRSDPLAVSAWNRAVAETWRITARQALEERLPS